MLAPAAGSLDANVEQGRKGAAAGLSRSGQQHRDTPCLLATHPLLHRRPPLSAQLYPALQPGFHAAAARCAPPPKAPPPPPAAEALARRAQLHSIVSPSILSADFANLQSDVQRVVDAGGWVRGDSWWMRVSMAAC